MCYGWILRSGEQILARGHGAYARGRDANSNIAEYLALIEGLDAPAVTSPVTRPLYRRAKRLAGRFQRLEWAWVPRKHNRAADQLTRRAMRQVHLDSHNYQAALRAIHPFNREGRLSGRFLPLLDLRVIQPGVLSTRGME
jgi:ribonuclease HI